MIVLFFFVIVTLFYVGTHLARGYSSGDPRNYYEYTQHNHKQSQQSSHIHTHCVVGGSTFFFKSFRGAGLGLNPEHPITLAQHHHQTATEPPLHPKSEVKGPAEIVRLYMYGNSMYYNLL